MAVQQPRTAADPGDTAPSPIDEMLVKTLPQTPGEVVGFTVPIGTARVLALFAISSNRGAGANRLAPFRRRSLRHGRRRLLSPFALHLHANAELNARPGAVGPRLGHGLDGLGRLLLSPAHPSGGFPWRGDGGVLFPVLTAPIWLSFYWKCGAGRFAASFLLSAALTLAVVVVVLWARYWTQDWHSAEALARWQPWLAPPTGARGVWQGVYWVYRLPVFIAYIAFVVTTLFWPAPKNLAK